MTSWFTVSVGFRRPHETKTKPDRFETTSEGGLRNVRFRDPPPPSGRSAEMHKTAQDSNLHKMRFHQRSSLCGLGLVQSLANYSCEGALMVKQTALKK